jgi:hypothetical protein
MVRLFPDFDRRCTARLVVANLDDEEPASVCRDQKVVIPNPCWSHLTKPTPLGGGPRNHLDPPAVRRDERAALVALCAAHFHS